MKFWFIIIASFGTVGVCQSIKSFNNFDLIPDSNVEEIIFWTCDTSTRIVGALIVFFFSNYVNEYIWMGVYAIDALIGIVLFSILTFTDKMSDSPWTVYATAGFLGVAIGGMWMITALTVFDDSGSKSFA